MVLHGEEGQLDFELFAQLVFKGMVVVPDDPVSDVPPDAELRLDPAALQRRWLHDRIGKTGDLVTGDPRFRAVDVLDGVLEVGRFSCLSHR